MTVMKKLTVNPKIQVTIKSDSETVISKDMEAEALMQLEMVINGLPALNINNETIVAFRCHMEEEAPQDIQDFVAYDEE